MTPEKIAELEETLAKIESTFGCSRSRVVEVARDVMNRACDADRMVLKLEGIASAVKDFASRQPLAFDKLEAENAALRERLVCEYCDADVNAPEAEPVQFGCCRKCLEKLQWERSALRALAIKLYTDNWPMTEADAAGRVESALAAARQSQGKANG